MAFVIPAHVKHYLLHDLSHCYDVGIQTNMIFTDFVKAFDIVPHKRLLYKLAFVVL